MINTYKIFIKRSIKVNDAKIIQINIKSNKVLKQNTFHLEKENVMIYSMAENE